ncbi:MAG: hypothetical protein KC766_41985 [Myxococcales bacterium]|nr:hypothetical protein [Myxococcales bacterium]
MAVASADGLDSEEEGAVFDLVTAWQLGDGGDADEDGDEYADESDEDDDYADEDEDEDDDADDDEGEEEDYDD